MRKIVKQEFYKCQHLGVRLYLSITATLGLCTFPIQAQEIDWIWPFDGFFDVASNWDPAVVPGINDDANIDIDILNITVTHRSGTTNINSLTSNEPFVINGNSTIVFSALSEFRDTLTLDKGRIGGLGRVIVSGETTWIEGYMRDSATTDLNGNLNITGDGTKSLWLSRVLNTAGTTTWGGNTANNKNKFSMREGDSVINNTGTWRDENGYDTKIYWLGFGFPVFNNIGTYEKVGNTITSFDSVTFNNTGTLSVTNGRFKLDGRDFTNEGILFIASGATFEFTGGNFTNFVNNDVITGSGLLDVPSLVNNAQISPGTSRGTLTLDGNYTQSQTGELVIEISGLIPSVEYDQFIINGNVTLDGALKVVLLNGYIPQFGDSFDVLDWSTLSGAFTSIDTSAAILPFPLTWDASQIYTTGELSIGMLQSIGDGDLAPWNDPDGSINGADLMIAMQLVLETRTPEALQYAHGDMDSDGDIDLVDLLMIQQLVLP